MSVPGFRSVDCRASRRLAIPGAARLASRHRSSSPASASASGRLPGRQAPVPCYRSRWALGVELKDGSSISLDSDGEIRSSTATPDGACGSIAASLFDVKHNPGWPFVVVAGRHQITDIGTRPWCEPPGPRGRDPHQGADCVGSDRRHRKRRCILAVGQRLTFAGDDPPKLDRARLVEVTAWQRGEVMLDARRTRAVAELIATMILADHRRSAVARLRISGTITPATTAIRVAAREAVRRSLRRSGHCTSWERNRHPPGRISP